MLVALLYLAQQDDLPCPIPNPVVPELDRRRTRRILRQLEAAGIIETRLVPWGRAGRGVQRLELVAVADIHVERYEPSRRPPAVRRPRRQEVLARIRVALGERCKLCGGPHSVNVGRRAVLVSCRKCEAPWPPTRARRAAYLRALGVDLRLPDDPDDLVTAR